MEYMFDFAAFTDFALFFFFFGLYTYEMVLVLETREILIFVGGWWGREGDILNDRSKSVSAQSP